MQTIITSTGTAPTTSATQASFTFQSIPRFCPGPLHLLGYICLKSVPLRELLLSCARMTFMSPSPPEICFLASCFISFSLFGLIPFFPWLCMCCLVALGLRCCSEAFSSCAGFSLRRLLSLWSTDFRSPKASVPAARLRSCSLRALGWCCLCGCGKRGFAVLSIRASSPTRNQTPCPCTGRWVLNHWTTWDVPVVQPRHRHRSSGTEQALEDSFTLDSKANQLNN